jgi:hypothetical protein
MVLKVVLSRVPTRVNAAIAATAISADQRIFYRGNAAPIV